MGQDKKRTERDLKIMGWSTGPRIMAPIIRAVCQELQHGYARERILVSILRVLQDGDCDDFSEIKDPPFERVWILSSGFMSGQAAYLPKRPPWWVKDLGKVATDKWLADYARGAEDRDLNYDNDESAAQYLPVPSTEESLDDRFEEGR